MMERRSKTKQKRKRKKNQTFSFILCVCVLHPSIIMKFKTYGLSNCEKVGWRGDVDIRTYEIVCKHGCPLVLMFPPASGLWNRACVYVWHCGFFFPELILKCSLGFFWVFFLAFSYSVDRHLFQYPYAVFPFNFFLSASVYHPLSISSVCCLRRWRH